MSWPDWFCRIVPYLGRRRAGEDLEQEMRLHVELERERVIGVGVAPAPAAAARAARRRLGNPVLIREDTRAVRGWGWLDGLGRDLRHVARGLRRSPGFTAVVVAVLGLGIGASTAVFSLVHGVLLSPLPFRDPAQLVTVQIHVREMEDRFPAFPASLRAVEAWAACRDVCAGVAAARPSRSTLTNAGDPRDLRSAQVTASFFDLLGVAPAVGRGFRAADTAIGGPGVAIVTHDLWQGAFGGDPRILGRVLTLDDERVAVIGVLPESLWLPDLDRLTPLSAGGGGPPEIFRPLRYTPEQALRFGEFDYPAIVRLAPGISAEQARPELTALTRDAFGEGPFTITPIVTPPRPADRERRARPVGMAAGRGRGAFTGGVRQRGEPAVGARSAPAARARGPERPRGRRRRPGTARPGRERPPRRARRPRRRGGCARVPASRGRGGAA